MLKLYYRVAQRLYRLRSLLCILCAISVVIFAGVLFTADGSVDSAYALAALTVILWTLWLLAIAYNFIDPVREVDPDAPFWTRFRSRFGRSLAWMLVLFMTALFLLAVAMTTRTIGIVFGG